MNKKGFTLVELAIVLVIIGLLVGGVLQGQELIKQAQIRNVISSMNQFDTAVNTFRAKYDNALPGDFSNAASFSVCPASGNVCNSTDTGGTLYNGNGDGDLEKAASGGSAAASTANAANTFSGEIGNFYIMLSNAGLVKGSFTALAGTVDIDSEIPSAPVGVGLLAVTYGGQLYYMTGVRSGFTAAAKMTVASSDTAGPIGLSLTPEEAYAIDSKIDDGKPNSGATQSTDQYNGVAAAFTAGLTGAYTTGCVAATTATGDYQFGNTAQACTLRVRASG